METVFTVCKRTEEIRPLLGTHTHSEEGQSGREENENPPLKGKATAQKQRVQYGTAEQNRGGSKTKAESNSLAG